MATFQLTIEADPSGPSFDDGAVGFRLVRVSNPCEGVLMATFNEPIKKNSEFFFAGNWRIAPVSVGARELVVTEVVESPTRPDTAVLRYEGGGSTYELTVYSITSEDGEAIEYSYNVREFEIVFGDDEAPTVRLFDTVFGPLGISQRTRSRRTMDGHVANRSIALAMDEQFRLRVQTLDGTAGRDGRPGKKRI